MSFGDAIRSVFQQYATFTGRAGRSEFWFWQLFAILLNIGVGVIDGIIGTGGGLQGLASLALLLPGLAVAVRRLHDIGKSGWWLLLLAIPSLIGGALFVFGLLAVVASMGLGVAAGMFGLVVILIAGLVWLGGMIWAIITFAQPSEPGANIYGLPPGTTAD